VSLIPCCVKGQGEIVACAAQQDEIAVHLHSRFCFRQVMKDASTNATCPTYSSSVSTPTGIERAE
jgi:hypothetical protein